MKRRKNNGFTLIELLAVIVILAIIALIATPIILGIVDDAKRDAFLRSVEMVVSTTDLDINTKPYSTTYTYTITDGDISNLNIPIKNTKGMNGSVKYDNKGNTAYAVNNGKYCVVKEYDGQSIIKDYDETCEYVDYPADSCFTLHYEFIDLEITDKALCETALSSMGFSSATALCNGEASSELGGMTLKQFLIGIGVPAEEMKNFGITPIYEDRSTGSISDYLCAENKIIIPEEINGTKIVAIEVGAFQAKKLVKIKIPDSVTSIGDSAFAGNQLTSIKIPSSVTKIGNSTFADNQLTNAEIPSCVISIGRAAFKNNQLTNVTLPSSVFEIGESAFENNRLTAIIIPESVTEIPRNCFANNQLTSVEIPSSVTNIRYSAFENNQLTSIIIPESVTHIYDFAFANNRITSAVIPSSVTEIGLAAFNNNQLPDDQAFIYKRNSDGSIDNTTLVSYGGAKKDNVIIPNTVTSIGIHAFSNNQLTSITIPSSVKIIKKYAFASNKLTSIVIPTSVTKIQGGAFNDNQLPDNQAFIYQRNSDGSVKNTILMSYGGIKRDNIIIPNTVTLIGDSAFDLNQLTSITIPNSVTTIDDFAFQNNQLTSVEIPSSVTSIGNWVFENNQLTSVEISSGVTSIGQEAFAYNQLTSIEIPSSVMIIKYSAFANNKLTSVTIKGKSSTSDFTSYGSKVFGWAKGYSDANITFVNE